MFFKEGITVTMPKNPHDGVGVWQEIRTTILVHSITWSQVARTIPHLRNLFGERLQVTIQPSWRMDTWDMELAASPDFVDRAIRILENTECLPGPLS